MEYGKGLQARELLQGSIPELSMGKPAFHVCQVLLLNPRLDSGSTRMQAVELCSWRRDSPGCGVSDLVTLHVGKRT